MPTVEVDKELESSKVIRYMIRWIQKRITRDIIDCLKYSWTEQSLQALYTERWRMNSAYKNFSPNQTKWEN